MTDSRINLKNPWLAALLAYLIPGAGHFYQGRLFKGAIYSIGILGTFLSGMALGDWRVVYYRGDPGNKTLGYFSQVLVGLPALPALVQARRAADPENIPRNSLDEPLSADFRGSLSLFVEGRNEPVPVAGRLELKVEAGELGREIRGTFTGTEAGGEPVSVAVGRPIELGRPVEGDPRRPLRIDVYNEAGRRTGQLTGTIPRSFQNWFEAPLSDESLQDLHGRLGKTFELALVFTWIAGLLNILAIWDALEGPAYGYGDEEPESDEDAKKQPAAAGDRPEPERTARSLAEPIPKS